jgi:hypothetical protein
MKDQEFKISPNGAFMGSHWEFETGIQTTHNVAVNILAAILHKAHTKKRICYTKGMDWQDFITANTDFLDAFFKAFAKMRNYVYNYNDIKSGVIDFLDRMEFISKQC